MSGGPVCAAGVGKPATPGAAAPSAPLVVIAVGNRSRGDDAIGPLLLDRLAEWIPSAPRAAGSAIELLEDYQLQVEHALDLVGRRLVLFVDAGTGTPAPYTFEEIAPSSPSASHSTHALAPSAVLGCYRQVTGNAPPPAFVLCVRGERFELGEEPSAAALANLEAAWTMLAALCARADSGVWASATSRPSTTTPPETCG